MRRSPAATRPPSSPTSRGRASAPELVVDEGGAVVEGVFPGCEARPCALIGVGEKAWRTSASPPAARAAHLRPQAQPPRACWAPGYRERGEPPHEGQLPPRRRWRCSTFWAGARRLPTASLFGNQWLFGGLLKKVFGAMGGINAIVPHHLRLHLAAGSPASNVLPPQGRGRGQLPPVPQRHLESLKAHVRRAAGEA